MDKNTLKPIELHIENEQKYLSYLFNIDASDCLTIDDKVFLNKTLKTIFCSIKKVYQDGNKVELDIILDVCKQSNQNITYEQLKTIKEFFSDFENIEIVKNRLKQDYLKQVSIKQKIEKLLIRANESTDINIEEVKKLNEQLNDSLLELESDEKNLLFFSDMVPMYQEILKNRDEGKKYTLGVHWLDKYITYPGEPGDMMSFAMRKGEGKTIFGLNLANVQINQKIPVIYFCFDMGWITIMDRWLCLREGFLQGELLQEDKTRDQVRKITRSLDSLKTIDNFIFYPAASMSLTELNSYLYKAKNEFRKRGVLGPNDNYCILYFDTLDMIDEFSGVDAYGIKYGINKLHSILRQHQCFAVNLLQLNENVIRAKKPKELEDVKKIRFTKEDIEGGASYASRSRVVIIGTRPKAMMKSFFPEEKELIDLEEDIMYLSIDKQNDGDTGRIPPLIFDTTTYRLDAKKGN